MRGLTLIDSARLAEVDQLDVLIAHHQDVARFEVGVDETDLVHLGQCVGCFSNRYSL
ncbi:MAG: hypothetical protein R3E58_11835 [Phycisphaerae bacterium]